MTVEQLVVEAAADGECHDRGNEAKLKRTLGGLQVFAISFAFISVAVGVFGTYNSLLQNAGPAGIWLWVVAAVGQTLVALVVAQFAARIALSGSSYQWASRLANPKIGWLFGWLSFWYLAIAGQRARQPGIDAVAGHAAKREHGAPDHAGNPRRSSRSGDRLDQAAGNVHLQRRGDRTWALSWSS